MARPPPRRSISDMCSINAFALICKLCHSKFPLPLGWECRLFSGCFDIQYDWLYKNTHFICNWLFKSIICTSLIDYLVSSSSSMDLLRRSHTNFLGAYRHLMCWSVKWFQTRCIMWCLSLFLMNCIIFFIFFYQIIVQCLICCIRKIHCILSSVVLF